MTIEYQKKVLIACVFQYNWSILYLKWVKIYYSQVFLEECKYIEKEEKVTRYITDEIEISSCKSDKEWIKTRHHD